jgi:serine/threonine protein kinase
LAGSHRTAQIADAVVNELVASKKITEFQVTALREGKPERLLIGNYLLLDKLGVGGLGIVYKAIQHRMKQVVALKVLSPAALESSGAVQRFRREVEAAGRLAHPNIIAALNADEVAGTHCLVTEFVDGVDLGRLVVERGPLPIAIAVRCVLQAASGLAHAHAAGVIHRDVKPSNLMIDKSGVVKILDLGLARFGDLSVRHEENESPLTQSGSILGTVDYMSPEQAENPRLADHRSDIYSLGCTFCYLLTGRPPFSGESQIELLLAHRERAIPSLRAARPEVSDRMDAIFANMIAKRADDRPQSMSAVIEILQSLHRKRGASEVVSTSGESPSHSLARSQSPVTCVEAKERIQRADPLAPTATVVAATPTDSRSPRKDSTVSSRKRPSKSIVWMGVVSLLLVLAFGAWPFLARRG